MRPKNPIVTDKVPTIKLIMTEPKANELLIATRQWHSNSKIMAKLRHALEDASRVNGKTIAL